MNEKQFQKKKNNAISEIMNTFDKDQANLRERSKERSRSRSGVHTRGNGSVGVVKQNVGPCLDDKLYRFQQKIIQRCKNRKLNLHDMYLGHNFVNELRRILDSAPHSLVS